MCSNVRMVERCQDLRFPLEAGEPIGIMGDRLWEDFDGDVAVQLRIARPIHFAHPAGAQERDDFIGADACASGEEHPVGF